MSPKKTPMHLESDMHAAGVRTVSMVTAEIRYVFETEVKLL